MNLGLIAVNVRAADRLKAAELIKEDGIHDGQRETMEHITCECGRYQHIRKEYLDKLWAINRKNMSANMGRKSRRMLKD